MKGIQLLPLRFHSFLPFGKADSTWPCPALPFASEKLGRGLGETCKLSMTGLILFEDQPHLPCLGAQAPERSCCQDLASFFLLPSTNLLVQNSHGQGIEFAYFGFLCISVSGAPFFPSSFVLWVAGNQETRKNPAVVRVGWGAVPLN